MRAFLCLRLSITHSITASSLLCVHTNSLSGFFGLICVCPLLSVLGVPEPTEPGGVSPQRVTAGVKLSELDTMIVI